ncbi:hypothetical protein L7F22_044518 [Adiantum nelumboides]|nr:hypothetical protein [Adiantum nelumboides]
MIYSAVAGKRGGKAAGLTMKAHQALQLEAILACSRQEMKQQLVLMQVANITTLWLECKFLHNYKLACIGNYKLTVAKDEHATCLKKLEAGKVQQLSDEKFGKALSLLDEQISATKLKLASVAEDDFVTRIQLASQLEAQESMQTVLGAEVEFLVNVVKEKEMQHNLLQEMLHRVEVGRRAYICPPPPSIMSPTLDNFTLPAKCAECEYGHNVNEALMLVVLPCKHTYHSMCFAILCAFTDQCMVQYCSMAIPRDAQSTVIWGDANMSCGSSGRNKVFSRVKTKDEPSLERLQVVRNEGIGGEDHGSIADTVNLKPAAASVDVLVTATKVMIGTEWLENKVQDLSAANAEEEKVEEEEAEGDNVEEEAEQQELAYANKDIAEVLEDLSNQGFSSAELDLGDDSPLGHFHKVLASRKGRVHLGSRSSPAKKWKPSAGEEIPKHTKRMTEVAYQNGQRVFVRPGALQFSLWCFDHFTVFVWSCAQVSNVSSLVCKAFPKILNKLAGRIMSQSQCTRHKGDAKVPKTNKPIFYKELSGFWHGNDKYNASNTLIVNDSAYKCFCNLRHCCIILSKLGVVPEHEFDGFLTENLVNWLWHWLLAPDRPQYAKENMMHTPLDNESLSVFHFAAVEC